MKTTLRTLAAHLIPKCRMTLLVLLTCLFGLNNPATGQTFTNASGISQAFNATVTPYPSTISVSGLSGTVSSVTVGVNGLTLGANPFPFALLLVGPGGQNLVLLTDAGAQSVSNPSNVNLLFSDEASAYFGAGDFVSASYKPTSTSPASYTFPSPAPSGPYNFPSGQFGGTGSATLASVFDGINPNGVWSLYAVFSGGNTLNISNWTLNFTISPSSPTTTTISSSNDPSFTGTPNNLVTFTATVTSSGNPVNSGTVTFSNNGVAVGAPVPLSNEQATLTTTFTNEGSFNISAKYNGTTNFATSNGFITQTVNNHTTVNGNSFCNSASGISASAIGVASPYPSKIFVSGLTGTISALTVSIDGFQSDKPSSVELLLVGPGNQTLVLLNGYGGTGSNPYNIGNIVFSDAGVAIPGTLTGPGTYKPTAVATSSLSAPAPVSPYNLPAPGGAATLASVFAGISPNGTWQLFEYDSYVGASPTLISSWCLNFTTVQPGPTSSVLSLTGSSPICNGASSSISVAITGGKSPYTVVYQDQNNNPFTVSNYISGSAISVSPAANTVYSLVSVTDADNNTGTGNSGTASVTVNPLPTATIGITGSPVCQQGISPTITFTGSGGTAPYTFTYTIGSGDPQTISDDGSGSVALNVETGSTGTFVYNLVSVVDASTTQCTQPITGQSASATVIPLPSISDVTGTTTCSHTAATLVASSSASSPTYNWYTASTGGTIGSQSTGAGGGKLTFNLVYTGSTFTTPVLNADTTCYVSVTDGGTGCTSLLSPVSVTVTAAPSASTIVVTGTTLCAGSAATLAASSSVSTPTYNWYAVSNSATIGSQSGGAGAGKVTFTLVYTGATYTTPVLTDDTTFYITVTDGTTGCTSSFSQVSVTVNSAPAFTATATAACAGSTGSIAVTSITGGSGTYNSCTATAINGPDNGVSYPSTVTNTGFSISGLPIADYSVNVTDNNGCTGIVTPVAVSQLPSTSATIGGTTAVCQGVSQPGVTFSGSGGTAPYTFTYAIGNGNAQTITDNGSGTVTLAVPTNISGVFIYNLTGVQGTGGCPQAITGQSATITVNPLPTATISASGTPVCQNAAQSPSVTFTGSGSTAPYTYTYSINSVTQPTVSDNGSGTISISAPTGASGNFTYALISVQDASSTQCAQNISNQSVTITINPLPSATISGTTAVCENASSPNISFSGSGGTAPYTYTYTINNSVTSQTITDNGSGSVTVPVLTTAPGVFTYTLTGVQDANGCPQTLAPQSAQVTVNPLPGATISTASVVTAVSTGNIASVDNAGVGSVYNWSIANGTITAGAGTNSITYTAGSSGSVSLSVSVTGTGGCGPVNSGTILVPITALACPNPAINAPWIVCAASTGNTASAAKVSGNKYVWTISNGTITAGAGTSSISYTAGSFGVVTLSVSVTNASGQCTVSSGKYFVLISPLPIATISASSSVCASSTGNIAYVPGCGTGATYVWSITNGSITSGTGTSKITYTAAATGTVTLSVTVTNLAGCKASSGSKSVAIVAYPVAGITAPSSVCAGSSANMASVANAGSGARYVWSISNGCITSGSGTSSISYTATKSGSVTLAVTVTNSSGCSTVSAKKVIPIVAAPVAVISTADAVCAGSTGNTATVAALSGASYVWTLSTGATISSGSGTNSIQYTAPSIGTSLTITVTVTNSSGCKASCTQKVSITAKLTPTFTSIPTLCLGAKAPALPVISKNGITGSWKPSSISTSSTGTTKYVFTPAAGNCAVAVTVSVTVQNCRQAAVADGKVVTPETSDANSIQGRSITVFPNPSITAFTLELKSSKLEKVEILVMDVMGHVLHHASGDATGTYQFGSNFIKGMYFVQVLYNNDKKVLKVIRQ